MKPHAVMLAAALTFWGPGGQPSLAEDPGSEVAEGRDDYQQKAEGELEQLEQQLGQLEQQLDAARGEARAKLQRALKDLRKKRDVVRQRLEQLRASGTAAWKALRDGVEGALEELRKGLEKTREDADAPTRTSIDPRLRLG